MFHITSPHSVNAIVRGLAIASVALVSFSVVPVAPPRAAAQTMEAITAVEEDWELVLNEPGPVKHSPQLHTAIAPFGDDSGYFAQILFNYRELPSYEPGGIQFQVWHGDTNISYYTVETAQFSTTAETITWTQRLELVGDTSRKLRLSIMNGSSATWGVFGGTDRFRTDRDTSLTDLQAHDPAASAKTSGVTFGGNRVVRFALKECRRYASSGLVSTDSTLRVVYPIEE